MKRLISIFLLCVVLAFTASAYADIDCRYIHVSMQIPKVGESLLETIADSFAVYLDEENGEVNGDVFFAKSKTGGMDIRNEWDITEAYMVGQDYLVEENTYYAVIVTCQQGGYEALAPNGFDPFIRSGSQNERTINGRASDTRFDSYMIEEYGMSPEYFEFISYVWNTYPVPATGDGMNLGLWIGMLAASAIGMMLIKRRARVY